ncbi:MAG: phosphatase PAP2 family protein [Anaeromyxobacter sp.]|nr:phosphatase PAP2 family protein [Anaeromyxobacter sp.]MBL0276299.1 phosphatase PAP2 family protein [Anaeromyxobacter sp.]
MRCLTASCCALLLSVAAPTSAAAGQADPATAPAATAPDIATPSPEASPKAVEDSKETAGAAELTPILPSPRDPLRPAFQLYAEVDLPVLAIGLVFASGRLVRAQPAYCAPLCDPSGLNSLDRATAGYWDTGWQRTSDYGLIAVGAGAVSLLLLDEGLLPGLNDLVVVSESALAGVAVTSMMTMAAGRPRPFLYGEKAPLESRTSADAGLSFLSSHSVAAFAVVTSTFVAMRRLHPGKKHAWVVLGVGGALATLVASARVMGGKHFITDVGGGAVVGASMGFLVPALHGSPVSIVPVVGALERGLALHGRF